MELATSNVRRKILLTLRFRQLNDHFLHSRGSVKLASTDPFTYPTSMSSTSDTLTAMLMPSSNS